MSGWIKLHRSLMKHWLFSFDDPDKALAWIDMLMSTNYKPGKIRRNGVLIDLNRGELGQSANGLADKWGWSRGKVIRFLSELEADGMIVQHKDKRRGKITICNYSDYQSEAELDSTTRSTTDSTSDDTSGGQQANDTKEVNNNKNEKKPNGASAKSPAVPYSEIREIYCKRLPSLKGSRILSDKTKKQIKAIWDSKDEATGEYRHRTIDFWDWYFYGINRADNFAFMSGNNDRGWKATIEHITKNDKFADLLSELIDKQEAGRL